jgi:hypothetical protein
MFISVPLVEEKLRMTALLKRIFQSKEELVRMGLIVALITAPRWESGVPTSEEKSRQISMSINLTFLKNKSKSWQPLSFSSVFIMKSRRSI